MFTIVDHAGLHLAQSELLQGLGFVHGITTRIGGVSKPPYATLNMAFHTGDKPEDVRENRRRACSALGMAPQSIVAGEQVHGVACRVVTAEDAGRGALEQESAVPETDILVTQTPGVLLASFYADCVPVLLVDPIRKAVGIAHCGWRGTIKEAPLVALEALSSHFGSKPSDVRAVIGPSIGPCCYQVSPDLADQFRQKFGPGVALGRQLDLRYANRMSLQKAGVPMHAVHTAPWCTCCQSDLFFSYRADQGQTGRLAVLLGIPK